MIIIDVGFISACDEPTTQDDIALLSAEEFAGLSTCQVNHSTVIRFEKI